MRTIEQIIDRAIFVNAEIKDLENKGRDLDGELLETEKINNCFGELEGLCYASGLKTTEWLKLTK